MKKWNFQNEVKKMQRKEIKSLHTELSEKEEVYRDEVKKAGYDNLHDYEASISAGLKKRITIIILLMVLLIFALSGRAQVQLYMGIGTGLSVTKQKPVAELQIGISDNNLVVQGGFLFHLDNKNPVLLNAQAGGRIYSQGGTGWQLTGGYCSQLISNDNKSRNKKTYIVSAQMFRPFGWGEWYVSGSYSPGYAVLTIGCRGVISGNR